MAPISLSGIRLCRLLGCFVLVTSCLLPGSAAAAYGEASGTLEADDWDGLYWYVHLDLRVEHSEIGNYIVVEWRFKQNGSEQWSEWYYLLENGSFPECPLGSLESYGAEVEVHDQLLSGNWFSDSITNVPWGCAPGDMIEVYVSVWSSDNDPLDSELIALTVPPAP